MAENSVKELKDYFATDDKPIGASEFMTFWKSLDDEEKDYYKTADLSA
jgi:hypothetical protein